MLSLANKKCIPCKGGTPPLEGEALFEMAHSLGNEWKVINEHHLEKEFHFRDFKTALEFTDKVGKLAEQENHHPNIHLSWGKVRIVLWTHTIQGLSESDFILAAKIETL